MYKFEPFQVESTSVLRKPKAEIPYQLNLRLLDHYVYYFELTVSLEVEEFENLDIPEWRHKDALDYCHKVDRPVSS